MLTAAARCHAGNLALKEQAYKLWAVPLHVESVASKQGHQCTLHNQGSCRTPSADQTGTLKTRCSRHCCDRGSRHNIFALRAAGPELTARALVPAWIIWLEDQPCILRLACGIMRPDRARCLEVLGTASSHSPGSLTLPSMASLMFVSPPRH